jgi:hypothetical protein
MKLTKKETNYVKDIFEYTSSFLNSRAVKFKFRFDLFYTLTKSTKVLIGCDIYCDKKSNGLKMDIFYCKLQSTTENSVDDAIGNSDSSLDFVFTKKTTLEELIISFESVKL